MAFVGRRVTVDTTSGGTILITGADAGSQNVSDSPGASLRNSHASLSVFLGGAGVTAAAGFELIAGATVGIGAIGKGDDLYGITASSSAVVHILEVG